MVSIDGIERRRVIGIIKLAVSHIQASICYPKDHVKPSKLTIIIQRGLISDTRLTNASSPSIEKLHLL